MAVTIKDVAREAGVSISTVSKVINNSYTISEATTEHVKQVMNHLHYYPNLRARNFVCKSTKTIVFITDLEKNSAFTNPHMFEIMCGIQSVLKEKDYALQIVSAASDEEQNEAVERIIAQQMADGIIIHGCADNKTIVPIIIKSEFPHMVIGCPNFESQLCWMDTNNYLSGEIAANHLLDEGYKSPAFIGGVEDDFISTHRLQGYRTVLSERGINLPSSYIKLGGLSLETAKPLVQELLEQPNRPDSIICANNIIALSAINVIQKNGLSIPDDVAIITFDDFPFSRITEPKLTVVNIDVFEMGLQAGSMILKKIKKPNLQIQSYSTLPQLIIRESTRK